MLSNKLLSSTILRSNRWYGDRALYMAGADSNKTGSLTIEYANIVTQGNTTSFGNLTQKRVRSAACSSEVRCVVVGGSDSTFSDIPKGTMEYFSIPTQSTSTFFGNMSDNLCAVIACSDGSIGIWALGYNTITETRNTGAEYITIDTTGNSVYFGDLSVITGFTGIQGNSDAIGGSSLGVFYYSDFLYYLTFKTPGNGVYFGDLTTTKADSAACSNKNRGIIFGDNDPDLVISSRIDFINIDTPNNSTYFGQLLNSSGEPVRTFQGSACANEDIATYTLYNISGGATDSIEYVNMFTLGNSNFFGNLTERKYYGASTSGSPS